MSLIILNRIAVMLAYMLPGFLLYRMRIITDEGAKDINANKIHKKICAEIQYIRDCRLDFSKF